MKRIRGKVALITGAASGIGRETALALAREGARLILCDVNGSGLTKVKAETEREGGECLMTAQVDVSKREAVQNLAAEVHELFPSVDILVNNAGIGVAGGILDVPIEEWERIIGINLMGVVYGCHYFVPAMTARGEGGHVVNVSSMLGYWIGPQTISYTTAKHGVFGLSESLREDLHGTGIGVSTICPGIVTTNIIQSTRFYGQDDESAMRNQVDTQYRKRNYTPDQVARAIVKAIKRNRRIVPVSPESYLMYYVTRFSPRLSRAIARWMADQIQGKDAGKARQSQESS